MDAPQNGDAPSDHLLRLLASVPVSSTILDLACGAGRHTEALLRLGFPVHACDPRSDAVQTTRDRVRDLIDEETAQSCVQERPLDALDALDATFDWVVADRAEVLLHSAADLRSLLETSRRLLEPGGWLYLTVPAASDDQGRTPSEAPRKGKNNRVRFSTTELKLQHLNVDLAESRPPTRMEENGESRIRALYRRVDGLATA